MEAYRNFAEVYDIFMDNVPYAVWSDYIEGILKSRGIADGLILELGCGTGSMTELLADKGYDMIGVDNSEEMLEIAMNKRLESGHDILYLLQDMREFELYGTVRAVISACDAVNYILEPKELTEVFRLVNNYLDPGGLFLFDFNTVYNYKDIIGNRIIAEDREDCSFIWDNDYDESDQINAYELTLFMQSDIDETLYRKYQEYHYQRGYTLEEIKALIEAAGLIFVSAFDAYANEKAHERSQRIFVVAQESGK